MAIKLVGNKFQADTRSNGKRYRKTFDSAKEAHKWLDYIQKVGQPPIEQKQVIEIQKNIVRTFSQAFNACYEREWIGTKNEAYVIRIGSFLSKFFGNLPLKDITLIKIDSFIANCHKKKLSPSTINKRLSVLSKTLKFAYEREWIGVVPRIKRFKEPEGRLRWYTIEEEKALLNWLEDNYPDAADLTKILLDTGLRISEALRIRWQDIRGKLLIIPERKAGNTSGIPMTKRVKEVLERRKGMKLSQPFQGMTLHSMGATLKMSRKFLAFMNIEGSCWHACRHTFISRLVQKGVQLKVVQQLAGHKTIQMTLRYAHLAPENLEDAIRILENA